MQIRCGPGRRKPSSTCRPLRLWAQELSALQLCHTQPVAVHSERLAPSLYWVEWHRRLAWFCDLVTSAVTRALCLEKPRFNLILCSCCPEILKTLQTKLPAFSFCTVPGNLWSSSCLTSSIWAPVVHTGTHLSQVASCLLGLHSQFLDGFRNIVNLPFVDISFSFFCRSGGKTLSNFISELKVQMFFNLLWCWTLLWLWIHVLNYLSHFYSFY